MSNNEKKDPKEETTRCNECGEETHVAEKEYHAGMCRECYTDARRAMIGRKRREKHSRYLDRLRHRPR